MPRQVTLKGSPVNLLGPALKAGDKAPAFRAVDGGFAPVQLADYKGKVLIISAVPSLDTPVCSIQTQRFNKKIASLPAGVEIITISMDLPFAQKRFCEAQKVDRIRILSDHVWREFGQNYGLLIENMGLLARSVWVIGKDGKVAYVQLVPEVAQEPDYAAALKAAKEAAAK